MKTQLFAISQYCVVHNVDPSFIQSLEEEGLIEFQLENEEKFVGEEQLSDLELFTRWHSDLGINVAGIDAIHNLLGRIREMQSELADLRSKLETY